jgi:hypothetical protein
MRKSLVYLLSLAFCALAFSQQSMNNDSVIKMLKSRPFG